MKTPAAKRRRTNEDKQTICQKYFDMKASGTPVTLEKLGQEYNVDPTTIGKWLKSPVLFDGSMKRTLSASEKSKRSFHPGPAPKRPDLEEYLFRFYSDKRSDGHVVSSKLLMVEALKWYSEEGKCEEVKDLSRNACKSMIYRFPFLNSRSDFVNGITYHTEQELTMECLLMKLKWRLQSWTLYKASHFEDDSVSFLKMVSTAVRMTFTSSTTVFLIKTNNKNRSSGWVWFGQGSTTHI
jgi:hypothetical protein